MPLKSQENLVQYTVETLKYPKELFLIISGDEACLAGFKFYDFYGFIVFS